MSDTDSFIDEVSEEVRRDRLFRLARRYGWIAILAVVLLVGGASWNEWRKAQNRAQAQDFGDAIIAALEAQDRPARAAALEAIEPSVPAGQVVLDLLAAAENGADAPQEAVARLLAIADGADTPQVYRQIATLKAVTVPDSGLSVEDRRARLEGLALAGGLTRLLAEEQLAMIEIETGSSDAAVARLAAIAQDAEATAGLRQRVSQVIVALGGIPEETTGTE